MTLKQQIITLRTMVRFLLPEWEAGQGGLMPDQRDGKLRHAADIRKFLPNASRPA
jgi:hypothetical protein